MEKELVSASMKDLDLATREAIIQVCLNAHNNPDFQHLFSYLPPEALHVMAYFGEQLASHAVVTTRWLQPEGMELLRTAYVDAVSTSPFFQGRGFGSAVMRRLVELIAGDYEIACLETDRGTFYDRLGWEEWHGPLAGRAEHGLIPTPGQRGIMIFRLPHTPSLDLNSLLTIECQPGRIW